jgi:hypothetical protein
MKFKDWVEQLYADEEYVAAGNQYATKAQKVLTLKYTKNIPEFITLNPIREHRLDANVTRMQNFLFELDNMELEQQRALIPYLRDYVASVVYSGGKSLHFVVQLEKPLEPLLGDNDQQSVFYSIKYYKKVWQEIAVCLGSVAEEVVEDLTFDPSCKNPSRLTRSGAAQRASNGKTQDILHIGTKTPYSAFEELGAQSLASLAESATITTTRASYNGETTTMEAFKIVAPASLLYKLQDKSWAAPENMYPELFKLTVWAIESSGVIQETMLEYMEEHTFPNLIEVGYPKDKLYIPITDAYNYMIEKEGD